MEPRYAALCACHQVFEKKKQLPEALAAFPSSQAGFTQELAYGLCRYYYDYECVLGHWLKKPIKDLWVKLIVMLGFYQLAALRTKNHAAVHETVELAKICNKSWAKALINALLRRWLRETPSVERLLQKAILQSTAPWLSQALQQNWPNNAKQIIEAFHAYPPLELCINPLQISRDAYTKQLDLQKIAYTTHPHLKNGICLSDPLPVEKLPLFTEGGFMVQAFAAQWACQLMDLSGTEKILDACAAPGGKTANMLMQHPGVTVFAADKSFSRLKRLTENFKRLQLSANIYCADIVTQKSLQQYDRILYDAPCSATGVITRHPEIQILRTKKQIQALTDCQLAGLHNLWHALKNEGILLYVTCSLLAEENDEIIDAFIKQTPGVTCIALQLPGTVQTKYGCQFLPSRTAVDGLYYAKLLKKSSSNRKIPTS